MIFFIWFTTNPERTTTPNNTHINGILPSPKTCGPNFTSTKYTLHSVHAWIGPSLGAIVLISYRFKLSCVCWSVYLDNTYRYHKYLIIATWEVLKIVTVWLRRIYLTSYGKWYYVNFGEAPAWAPGPLHFGKISNFSVKFGKSNYLL